MESFKDICKTIGCSDTRGGGNIEVETLEQGGT